MAKLLAFILLAVGIAAGVLWAIPQPEFRKSTFSPVPHARIVRNIERGGFQLEDDFYFIDAAGIQWKAPRGTLTDGASIPQAALAIFGSNFSEKFLDAAVVHDAYCGRDNASGESYRKRSRQEVHRMFYEASLVCGAQPVLAKMMYAGVIIGGPTWEMKPVGSSSTAPQFDPQRVLTKLPDKHVRQEMAWCAEWIEAEDPTPEAVEKWSEARRDKLEVAVLLSQLNNGLSTTGNVPADPVGGGMAPLPQATLPEISVEPPDWIRTRGIVGQYCLRCHGPEADVPLHNMKISASDQKNADFWQRAAALLQSGQPHPDATTPQPSESEKAVIIRWVGGKLP